MEETIFAILTMIITFEYQKKMQTWKSHEKGRSPSSRPLFGPGFNLSAYSMQDYSFPPERGNEGCVGGEGLRGEWGAGSCGGGQCALP